MIKSMWLVIFFGIISTVAVIYFLYSYFFGSTELIYRGACGERSFEISLVTTNKNWLSVGPETDLQIAYTPDQTTYFIDRYGYGYEKNAEILTSFQISESAQFSYWDVVLSGVNDDKKKAIKFADCMKLQIDDMNSALAAKGIMKVAFFKKEKIQLRSVRFLEIDKKHKFTCSDSSAITIMPDNNVYYSNNSGGVKIGYLGYPSKDYVNETSKKITAVIPNCKNQDGETLVELFPKKD